MEFSISVAVTAPIQFALDKFAALNREYAYRIRVMLNPSLKEQSYVRKVTGDEINLECADEAACMYALLDLYQCLKTGSVPADMTVEPHLVNRGIKFNIPLDSRTPSYSDASTSARANIPHMWEKDFWTEFLDRLAEEKYNVLSLWTMCPFPSLVVVPEYPKASLNDVKISTRPFHAELSGKGIYDEDHHASLYTVKKITIGEKIDFWRWVMEYARSRCIRVFIFTWNMFAYGTEDSGYGITDDPGNPVTRDYVYCGTKALIDTYPLLAGIGVTAGENLNFNGAEAEDMPFEKSDVAFIADTYGRGVKDYIQSHPDRKFTYIHRMQMARYDRIMEGAGEFPCDFEISFKYSQAHMYSSTRPDFIGSFLKEKAPDVKVWLTVRNDDYYMMRWGNPEFAREYLANMPLDCMRGFYMGADGFTWARDYMTVGDDRHVLFADKMWYMFRIWGQLSYNIHLPEAYFKDSLRERFNLTDDATGYLYTAWKEASCVLPGFNCIHWHDFDFQWYPEGCCMYSKPLDKLVFADIHEFMQCPAMPYTEYMSVADYAAALENGAKADGITPAQVLEDMKAHMAVSLENLSRIDCGVNPELARTLTDIRLMNLQGSYFVMKEEAALLLARYERNGVEELHRQAVKKLTLAADYWKRYSALVHENYIPQQLDRLCAKVDVTEFNETAELDIALAQEMKH